MQLTIGKLAKAAGVGVETVRYYQRRGLLDTPARAGGEGWGAGVRRYGETDLSQLKFIRSAQTAGFTLSEIGELLEFHRSGDRIRVRELSYRRIAALDAEIAVLQGARSGLAKLVRQCASREGAGCPILEAFDS